MAEIKEVLEGVSKKYGKPLSTYKIVYDSAQNQLEPIYYWLLDFMEDLGFKVEKVVDNFMSSPGSFVQTITHLVRRFKSGHVRQTNQCDSLT